MPTRRNPYVMHPLMRKGGVHQKSGSGCRQTARQSLKDELDDYMEKREEQTFSSPKGGEESTLFVSA